VAVIDAGAPPPDRCASLLSFNALPNHTGQYIIGNKSTNLLVCSFACAGGHHSTAQFFFNVTAATTNYLLSTRESADEKSKSLFASPSGIQIPKGSDAGHLTLQTEDQPSSNHIHKVLQYGPLGTKFETQDSDQIMKSRFRFWAQGRTLIVSQPHVCPADNQHSL